MDVVRFIVGVVAAVRMIGARCPDLEPPVNGVLKCQAFDTNLLCTATCYKGYEFQSGQHVVQRTCLTDSNSWLEGLDLLPDCIRLCANNLMDDTEKELRASSSLVPTDLFGPRAALLSKSGAWRPAFDNILQFIQVDLGSPHTIRGWKVQGDGQGSYVRLFRLLFSLDGVTWTPYSDGRVTDKFFTGSFDSRTEVTQWISRPQVARYVRVNPLSWHQHIALQWDLLGCPYQSNPVTFEPTTATGAPGCEAPLPPLTGAVNCERNDTHVMCTAYCLDSLVFRDLGPAIDMICDPKLGFFTNTPLPPCVERDTAVLPFVNISGPCLQEESDCFHMTNGDFQYCGDCHYFSTCSEGYFFVRPCPEHLQYDSQYGLCNYESSTCSKKRRASYREARVGHAAHTVQHVLG